MRRWFVLVLVILLGLFATQVYAAPFTDNDNGTVTDSKTGLMWQQGEPGYMTWGSALSYCEGLPLGGHSDWRLPNIKELESLTDDARYYPAIDTNFFPNALASYYWSSTTGAFGPSGAWGVGFSGGGVYGGDKDGYYYVRCVRGGQSEPPTPPFLISPADGETVSNKIIALDWQDVPGASGYEVWMDNNCGFGSPEVKMTVTASTLSLENWVPDNVYCWKVRSVFSDGSTSEWSEVWQFTYHLTVNPRPVFVPVYRLYNGCCQTDHFYTTSTKQRDIALNSSKNCDSPPCPSYPSYYKFEKIECYASDRNFPGGVPVMRLNSDTRSCHYYTTDEADKDNKLANPDNGFTYEGIAFFVYPTQVLGSVPVYHLFRDDTPVSGNYDNFYTISEFERDNAVASFGYQYIEGDILGYAMPYDPSMSQNPAGHAGQGINTENGNFRTYESTDFGMPGRNLLLAFTRAYNSLYSYDEAPLGYGWTHSYNIHLYDNNNTVTIYWGNGSQDSFTLNGTTYVPNPGNYDKLVKINTNTYTITKKDQTVYTLVRIIPNDMKIPARLSTIQEKNGNTITCNYNSDGDLYQIVDTVGRTLALTYDAQHRITNITDPISRNVQFTYDAVGDVVSSRDARGNMTQYKYDSNAENAHRMIEITKPRGNKVNMVYNDSHRVVSQNVGNAANSVSFNYDGAPGQTRITYPSTPNSPGGNVYHSHDENYRLTSVTDPDNKTASWAYTDPLNAMKPSSFSDKKGCPSNYTYDERGNMLTVTDCLNHFWTYTYDEKNNLRTSKDPQNHTVTYEYDPNGNLKKIIDAAGNQTTMTYTPYGQLETVTNANGHTTTYTYDTQGNLTRITDPEGNQTNYTYDAAGRKISMTDANSHTTTYDYDNNDNLIKVQPPIGSPATYDYDTNNNLEAIHFAGGTVRFTYNDKDLLTSETDQLSHTTSYSYDDLGHLTQKVDANGNTISYYYDALGRLTSTSYPGGTSISSTYDENSNLRTVTDQHGTSTFTYDELNRIKSYINNYVGKTVGYDYDADGNRTKITYPDAKEVIYIYDENNRLETVRDWLGGITRYEYDPAGNLFSVINPNSTTTTYGYDLAERLTSLANKKPDTTIINSYSYILDGVGNHLQENRTEPLIPTINRKNTAYTYDLSNRLLTADSTTFGYDNNGNMTSKNNGGLITNYIYDYENRLTQVASEANTTSYKYDGLGNRIARIQNGNETKYLLDLNGSMSQVLAETDSSGNITDYYVYGLGLISRIGSDDTRHVYHSDSRGSTIAMTDSLGNISHQYTYDEFGNLSGISEADTNLFRYVGGYGVMDEGNGLSFMRARYYDPEIGRFLNEDPLGFEGGDLNLYAYVKGNPIIGIDPSGFVCGTGTVIDYFVPDFMAKSGKMVFDFTQACNRHDVNFADPNKDWHESNRIFLNDMLDWCEKYSSYKQECKKYAYEYYEMVESEWGYRASGQNKKGNNEIMEIIVTESQTANSTPVFMFPKIESMIPAAIRKAPSIIRNWPNIGG
jgi:RHS repeat-associated protein